MESGSDSDASHISATPPRDSFPSPALRPHLPSRRPQSTSTFTAPTSKPPPQAKPKPKRPPPPATFPSADFSSLPALSARPHSPSASASFANFVRSRKPSFDPSQFQGDKHDDNAEKGACAPSSESRKHRLDAVVKTLPNWIGGFGGGSERPEDTPKRFRFSSEGNFVKLNINGYGRKYAFRSGKRSGGKWCGGGGRRWYKGKTKGGGALEESGLVPGRGPERREESYDRDSVEEAVAAVRQELSDENLEKLLRITHGYESFREGQKDAIKRVVAGKSTMLVLPTGSGKSLCYQLPALILPGVTLVVSPLVALMVDQLQKLPPMIPGALLCSSQTMEEVGETLRQLCEGSIKVLYVSPERFFNPDFLSVFEGTPFVSLLVVDEAHCLSEWSHNFRPAYLRLRASMLCSKLQVECILAMTATATAQTLNEIMSALQIDPFNLIRTCQIRENLQLSVTMSGNRLKDLVALKKSSPLNEVKSTIIYCKFQAETEIICRYLGDNNISSKCYHGGIPARDRHRIQEQFSSGKLKVVVATVAFGMGLDKSDVGAVIHYSMPESLEEYVQETGRAGRDGRLSYCHLLLDDGCYYKLRSFLYSDGIDEHAINKLLFEIFESDPGSAGKLCSLVKDYASKKFDIKEEVIFTILTQLELGDPQYLLLLPQLNVTCTLYFHKLCPALLANKDNLVAVIIQKSENKQGSYVFDIPMVANTLQIEASDVLNHLQNLKVKGEITYEITDKAFCYRVLKKPDDILSLASNIEKWLSDVQSCKVWKLDAMFNAASYAAKECQGTNGCSVSVHTKCMQKNIMDYFCTEKHFSHNDLSSKMKRSSPFLRADIKVFLQNNASMKFTPRAVARIMHGIPSPAFPSANWSNCHFWGRYSEVDFSVVMEAATAELVNFIGKGGL